MKRLFKKVRSFLQTLFKRTKAFFKNLWIRIKKQWILFLYLCAIFLRKKAIYKKFLNTIHYLINYELQPYRIVIFQSTDKKHYAEYSRWGYETWWEPIIPQENGKTQKLMDSIGRGPGLLKSKVIELGEGSPTTNGLGNVELSYKNFSRLREEVRTKLGIEKGVKEKYYDFGIELYQEAGLRFGQKEEQINDPVTIKPIFKERLCKAMNCSIIFFTKDGLGRDQLILDILHGLMNDGLLYITSRYQPRHSLRRINPEFNLTEKGKAFVTDFSEISNKSDELLKAALDKIDIPGKSS